MFVFSEPHLFVKRIKGNSMRNPKKNRKCRVVKRNVLRDSLMKICAVKKKCCAFENAKNLPQRSLFVSR